MPHSDSDQLRCAIELDKTSGRFELDGNGYTRFYPSDKVADDLNKWMAEELQRAAEEHAPIFAACADNIETYTPIRAVTGSEQGQPALIPSPIARNPADQKIATTVNNVLRPDPIVSFDARFKATYPVAVPVPAGELRAIGRPVVREIDEMTGMPVYADDAEEIPVPLEIDAEILARRFQQKVEFDNREKRDFAKHFHKVVHACVTGASPAWWKVSHRKKKTNFISPKIAPPIVRLDEEVDEYTEEGCVQWDIIPYCNILRPNLDQDVDDLEWIAERTPKTPTEITEGYETGEYFLIDNDGECEALKKCTQRTIENDAKERTDRTTKKWTPLTPKDSCDVWEVPFYRYLKIAVPENAAEGEKPKVRRFSMKGIYHLGAKKFIAIYRNPYNHQLREYVPFTEYLDGGSTVGIVKFNQKFGTHLAHATALANEHANKPLYWYDPLGNPTTVAFFSNRTEPVPPGFAIPGKEGVDWGIVRGGWEHYSQLELMQWNASQGYEAAKSSEYENGQRVVSHTSPATVGMMLERGGETQRLFLRLLDRGVRKVMKLTLEVERQFNPTGGQIPVRDPVTKTMMMVPYLFPVGDVLDNFKIVLTASDDALMRERDPELTRQTLREFMEWSRFVAEVATPLLNPQVPPEDQAIFRRIIEGGQALWDPIIGAIRTDEEKFDMLEPIDSMLSARQAALAQIQQQQMMGGDGAGSPQPAAAGPLPGPAEDPQLAGPAPAGAEPGMAGGVGETQEGGGFGPM